MYLGSQFTPDGGTREDVTFTGKAQEAFAQLNELIEIEVKRRKQGWVGHTLGCDVDSSCVDKIVSFIEILKTCIVEQHATHEDAVQIAPTSCGLSPNLRGNHPMPLMRSQEEISQVSFLMAPKIYIFFVCFTINKMLRLATGHLYDPIMPLGILMILLSLHVMQCKNYTLQKHGGFGFHTYTLILKCVMCILVCFQL